MDQEKITDLEGSDTHPGFFEDEYEEHENIHKEEVKVIVAKRRSWHCHIIMKFHVIIAKSWPIQVLAQCNMCQCVPPHHSWDVIIAFSKMRKCKICYERRSHL